MSTFKLLLHARSNNVVKSGLCFIIVTLMMAISPAINPLQEIQAAISEEMPAIPAEILADWKDQDGSNTASVIDAVKTAYPEYASKITGSGDEGYKQACHWRRVGRMKPYESDIAKIMCTKHYNFGGFVVGYHDNTDRGNTDWTGTQGSALCVLDFANYYPPATELLKYTDQVIRDPCVYFDGTKVLIAISGKGAGSGYKIYEMEIATKKLTQLTFDPQIDNAAVADFEPCYLPNGDIMFTSTRNFGIVDCAFEPSTNMFLMNREGKYMRQIGFDQVNTFYPVLMEDGTVLYTRWEYNDRDLQNSMGLFKMFPDGANQTEWFGNQTSWPYSQIHGRPIPNTRGAKVICIAGGHHGPYCGELMMIDREKGTNGKQSITMIAPTRETKPSVQKSDQAYGNVKFIAQNPYPLDTKNFLVSWRKTDNSGNFRLYFMNIDGTRELLAWASGTSVSQPVLLKPWAKTPITPIQQAKYTESTGSFTMQNVYYGEGMKGIDSSTHIAKSLRVIALHYRAAGGTTGAAYAGGPAGAFTPQITCPISSYGCSWECKEVLGEAKIFSDGSAAFTVPARTPVYFQVIDTNGYCIATMRSWSTLMPGEKFACTGCHEDKIKPPPPTVVALAGSPKPLEKPLGIENKRFDYKQLVQPIFDSKCVKCHTSSHSSGFDLSGNLVSDSRAKKSYAKSYNSLTSGLNSKSSNNAINIVTIFSQPEQLPPYSFGSSKSGIMTKALNGTNPDMNKLLNQTEKNIIACWIDLMAPHNGKYNSYMSSGDSSAYQKLLDRRTKWAAIEKKNIDEMLLVGVKPDNHGSVKSARSITEQLRIGYVPAKRALVLKKFSRGNLRVLDLRGRVIYCMKLSNQPADGDVTISLPAPLGIGLYLATFESANGIRQAKISITE